MSRKQKTEINQDLNDMVWDRIQFIRLLGEICAAGLTRAQYKFLQESAGMSKRDVDRVLRKADDAYDSIKASLKHEKIPFG